MGKNAEESKEAPALAKQQRKGVRKLKPVKEEGQVFSLGRMGMIKGDDNLPKQSSKLPHANT